ncbi:cysteine-rich receptor-like protein kinase 42 [Cornus florida]|uniref:cysteine-rich receptor-like protein kinase 42 n=1 Tax=Cornus florida TaxID=4283 RepID=UPI0028A22346|nr:cysteine-rich receptor-like protein kinase 42 [Cornus florida]
MKPEMETRERDEISSLPNLNSMQFSALISSNLTWVFFLFFFINFFSLSQSDPRISVASLFCGNSTPPPNTNYVPTFVKEMEVLSQLVATNHWGHNVANSTPPIYGLAQCFQDLSHTDCLLCYAASRTKLPRCLPHLSARIYLDGCFQRYENYSFFNESVDPIRDSVNCSSSYGDAIGDEAFSSEFRKNVGDLVDNVTRIAAANKGFGVVEAKGVFGLAQCWKTVSRDGCRECLEKAGKEVRKCVPSKEGRGLNAGCYLRYSTEKFYNDEAEEVNKHSGNSLIGYGIAIALAGAAFFMLSLSAAYAGYVRFSKLKEERENLGQVSTLYNKSSLNFKYETLEKATDYFDSSRKIGQGGAGSVFKGTLPGGKTVAVKRLLFNSRQWVDEFFNEVNLVSGIQHKNLVKLLGCSIEGPESLLVYEYAPNKSLDQFLFDKDKIQILNWNQRFNIVLGTAEGLAYLHGGSQVRIIHRDIKSSNILLDENLTPKIADFGLARCFAADKTHLSTGIAGTLGYMAPEYLVRGQLTEKADVYSFGVLVLEIVCGRTNNASIEDSGSLLHIVWKLYRTDRLADCVDPCLENDFPEKEASRVLQLGLLCTQASVACRPSMDEVVQMLTNKDCEMPLPNQPPYLNASMLQPNRSIRSSGINSLVSNILAKLEASDTSTESSFMQTSDGLSKSQELQQK